MKSNVRRGPALALTLAAFSLVACGDSPPAKAPEQPQPVASAPPTETRLPATPPTPDSAAVHISQEITTACHISDPDAYFAFDSSHVRPDDARVLGTLANCFMSGPLKGHTMKLVGHADPRGSSDYNMTLGQSRADSVASYLTGKGLDKAKEETTTRGAMDATGSDDPGWARDRRVDIMLAQ